MSVCLVLLLLLLDFGLDRKHLFPQASHLAEFLDLGELRHSTLSSLLDPKHYMIHDLDNYTLGKAQTIDDHREFVDADSAVVDVTNDGVRYVGSAKEFTDAESMRGLVGVDCRVERLNLGTLDGHLVGLVVVEGHHPLQDCVRAEHTKVLLVEFNHSLPDPSGSFRQLGPDGRREACGRFARKGGWTDRDEGVVGGQAHLIYHVSTLI